MKIKTNELTDRALDWAVAKCEGPNSVASCYYDDQPLWLEEAPANEWSPSIDWNQGGPIIERERIDVTWHIDHWTAMWWADNSGMAKDQAQRFKHNRQHSGPTPLVAAMRCYVASKLGDIIDIPEELLS
jgi:hypothetical protein